MLVSTPAPAIAQIVTPLPGPSATATAAAVNAANAQVQQRQGAQMQNTAADYRAKADQLEAQGTDAINNGKAQYDAAVQDAQKATDAINAQQFGVASELITRAQSNINAGQGQLDAARETIGELKTMVYTQTEMIDTLAAQLQKAQSDYQALQTANSATIQVNQALQAQLAESKSHFTVNPAIASIVGVVVLFGILGFVVWKWSHRDPVIDPTPAELPLDGDYTISNDEIGG